ncbi:MULTISPECIES: hypothetical protein [unclassified Pseudomonas]|uniref:hypothetical protein n=1 Tax=unclassified Pseudomonas TaxID=196821 RepID=UPI0002A45B62|nr:MULTISPECIES: hypothetical protein [unclassified Pseudomonas]NTX91112.1 hypothetical protein [Pseudomonas sp. UMA643]NTY18578.1 hypothetical protein [Pseudomonas sp. UMC3103]NTY23602.1 hypothetical protein [Pseudomonas sp. UMA603]NTY29092.1 hypothetical protein [Pseudomonas sp. UMC3129]NTY52235.1 hypothetical protein [Pseudomonas sp. UMC631]
MKGIKKAPIKGGILLIVSSLAAFLASALFSIILTQELYGKITTLFSIASILIVISPIGTNFYFLTNRETFYQYQNSLTTLPVAVVFLLGLPAYFIYPTELAIAFNFMAISGSLSIQGILFSQIEKDSYSAAIYQSNQSLIKFFTALIVLLLYFSSKKIIQDERFIAYALIAVCIANIPTLLKIGSTSNGYKRAFDYSFFEKIGKKQRWQLLSFWFSAILGVSYSLGVVPLTSYAHGFTVAAYLGIYFIFWSGSNILITATINNHFWPIACSEHQSGGITRSLILKSALSSTLISIATGVGMLSGVYLFSARIWTNYPDIENFLYISTLALMLRPFSAWIGMIFLSIDSRVIKKAITQLFCTILMSILILKLDISTPYSLAWILVLLETTYLAGYIVSSAGSMSRLIWKTSR